MKASVPSDRREQPALSRLTGNFELQEIVNAIADLYGVPTERITGRSGTHREARRLAIFAADRFCRARFPQTYLAEAFHVGLGAFGSARARVAYDLPKNEQLRQQLSELSNMLNPQ